MIKVKHFISCTVILFSDLFPLSTDNAVTGGVLQHSQDLSNDDVTHCVTARLSLNLTIDNKITFLYVQNKKSAVLHGENKSATLNATSSSLIARYEQSLLQSRHEVNFRHKRSSSRSQDVDEVPETTKGLCSILVEAPQGKVLSILFLNQMCSRDNDVRIHDSYGGWSATLDGCNPWMSPGYDVTTANRSARMVIGVRNLTVAFRLKVQVEAVAARMTDGIMLRYVSSVLGYIQTPGWHPFARQFSGSTSGTVTVMVPSNQVTLISVIYSYVRFRYCPENVENCNDSVTLFTASKDRNGPKREWQINSQNTDRPGEVLLPDLKDFRFKFVNVHREYFHGIRVLFSFHQFVSAPQRSLGGLWNCSVPFWPDFQQHFVCNRKTECAGREDEMRCPDISCQEVGTLLYGVCYIFLHLSHQSWHNGNPACKRIGAVIASFPSVDSWYHLAVLCRTKKSDDFLYIGLRSPDAFHTSATQHIWSSAYVLCQVEPAHDVQSSPNTLGKDVTSHEARTQTQSHLRKTFWGHFPVPSVSCPDQHRTRDFLACDAFSACWHDYDVRSSDDDVTTDDDVVAHVCADIGATSLEALFPCHTGASYFPYSLVCDHVRDCVDNSDEDFCVFPPCSLSSQYRCSNGQCLPFHNYCDEFVQCVDGSDEAGCLSRDFERFKLIVRPRPPAVVDFNGKGWLVYDPLTAGRETDALQCPDTHIFCPGDGYCVPVYVRCNGLYDCPGREDEAECDSYKCPGLYRCRGLINICLHPDHLCDGWPQCPQHDDELFCNLTCPVNCTCLGYAFTCASDFHAEPFSRLRYLDAGGTGLEPGSLVKNKMLVYLSLTNCNLIHIDNLTLPNLLSLNLNDNLLSYINVADLNTMSNLRNLSLARNPLSGLFASNCSSVLLAHKNIRHIDLTGVEVNMLHVSSDLPFPSLLSLNMSQSSATRLIGDGFQSLKFLRILDLRGCPMNLFPRRLFKDLQDLRLVFADNYKLCCEANLPGGFNADNCKAPFNEISSCDALLRADIYRICLSVLATLALFGNLSCFCLRALSLTGRGKTGFNVFVTHLCVSDFLMGVFMAMIGVADRHYLGIYVWEDGRWRHSAVCQVAGVLALLSSEVSALVICLITLDRFLVIRFPLSHLRFSPISVQVVSFLTWTVGVVLVIVPFLPVTAYRHFYGQTGICVPLPITRNDFAGHHYAFGVMILLNLVVFLVIAAGQISVYLSMTSNAMSSMDSTRKSRDLIVARRLLTVVVSDFLCWFPLGLLGLLAAQGVPIPGEVNVAMAIFVLPLNSALNPFLYTLNTIQEKRQRATEVKLLKMIMDIGQR